MRCVLDTNVLLAAVRSARGASRRLLERLADERLAAVVSVPLFAEYEEQLRRLALGNDFGFRPADVDLMLDLLAARMELVGIDFLWRPQLRDPDDEMVIEAAINAGADVLVTFNTSDFQPIAGRFRLEILTPREALARLVREEEKT